jgi:hypothetical protein
VFMIGSNRICPIRTFPEGRCCRGWVFGEHGHAASADRSPRDGAGIDRRSDRVGSGRDGHAERAPAAGQSIATSLASVTKAWFDVVPSLSKELTLLGGAVTASATMMEKVEVQNRGRFDQFSR